MISDVCRISMSRQFFIVLVFSFLLASKAHISASPTNTDIKVSTDDETDTAQTFNVFEIEQSGISSRPEEDHYPPFYSQYEGRLQWIKNVPSKLYETLQSADMYLLRAPLSRAFRHGFKGDEHALTHNGIGFVLKDKLDQEMRRISFGYWGLDAGRSFNPSMKKDGSMTFHSRAIMAYTVTKNEWEWGYWSNATKLATLNSENFLKAIHFSKEFGEKHPYISAVELYLDDKLISPAITCNSYVQWIINDIFKKDVYEEKLMPMGFFGVELESQTNPKLSDVDYIELDQLPVFPLWYDSQGLVKGIGNTPGTIYVGPPKNSYIRTNVGPPIKSPASTLLR